MIKRSSAVTLLELLIAVAFFSLIVIAAATINVFGRYYLSSADKRAKVQNELSFAMEHMTKYVSQGVRLSTRAPLVALANGFNVSVDPSALNSAPPITRTPEANYVLVNYQLVNNTLTASYTTLAGAALTPPLSSDTLSTRVLATATFTKIPNPVPTTPDPSGFYINLTEPTAANPTVVEICLVGRYLPGSANPPTKDNPQVILKTRVYSRGAPAR